MQELTVLTVGRTYCPICGSAITEFVEETNSCLPCVHELNEKGFSIEQINRISEEIIYEINE